MSQHKSKQQHYSIKVYYGIEDGTEDHDDRFEPVFIRVMKSSAENVNFNQINQSDHVLLAANPIQKSNQRLLGSKTRKKIS